MVPAKRSCTAWPFIFAPPLRLPPSLVPVVEDIGKGRLPAGSFPFVAESLALYSTSTVVPGGPATPATRPPGGAPLGAVTTASAGAMPPLLGPSAVAGAGSASGSSGVSSGPVGPLTLANAAETPMRSVVVFIVGGATYEEVEDFPRVATFLLPSPLPSSPCLVDDARVLCYRLHGIDPSPPPPPFLSPSFPTIGFYSFKSAALAHVEGVNVVLGGTEMLNSRRSDRAESGMVPQRCDHATPAPRQFMPQMMLRICAHLMCSSSSMFFVVLASWRVYARPLRLWARAGSLFARASHGRLGYGQPQQVSFPSLSLPSPPFDSASFCDLAFIGLAFVLRSKYRLVANCRRLQK